MTIRFTKMHGAGNDFVVLNNLEGLLNLELGIIKSLADRHFGVGADQILVVEKPLDSANDFKYRIFNADGQEVQQCGNGARCFAQYVLQKGLTDKKSIRVETLAGVITPEIVDEHRVRVNMGQVRFDPAQVPFVMEGLTTRAGGGLIQYQLPIDSGQGQTETWASVASMGNPHVVLLMDRAPSDDYVQHAGSTLESHPRFPERVNVGFLTVLEKTKVR
ncbi:MAG: diaminopimelate epimerase, partial [Limnobacter sp.]|nr:diaminopimelate epimerase [Limnobacter sp.]